MSRHRSILAVALFVSSLAFISAPVAHGQVGQGILDANLVPEAELAALVPGMTAEIAKALVAARPFASIVDLNKFLVDQKLSKEQIDAFYQKAFVHVNLNTATRDEILLIPGAGNRMAREFPEYRPWKTWGQFDKEISKYVGQPETDRLKKYVFIPVNLNTATDADIMSIPGAGQRMTREFKEYRPWKSQEQFQKEIGKYVNAKEVARLWRFVVIQ
jgi:DNA uptake protein ComE-like DNA-binding protein